VLAVLLQENGGEMKLWVDGFTNMIYVLGPKNNPPDGVEVINTTSRSFTWSKGLSPFFVGPIPLYGGYEAKNMENAWQFSKCYYNHVDLYDNPTPDYFAWAKAGWDDIRAHRYPMGKGVKPLFSFWDGQKLDYVTARKTIYLPLYAEAVKKTYAFQKLREAHAKQQDTYLFDFDAHGLTPGSFDYWDLWNNPNIKVGHGYVLAMLLEGII
jgi:hypothetical protein